MNSFWSCNIFTQKRPPSEENCNKHLATKFVCNFASPLIVIATGFGDPHMVTLDGTPFTFNGHGEYFILKVSGVDFTLQGRMEPLTADDGTLTRATVYTAFAAKEAGSHTVQVILTAL